MFQSCNSLTDQGLSIDRSGLIVFVRAYKVSCTAEGLQLPNDIRLIYAVSFLVRWFAIG